jgi:hypothetical protein
VTSAEPTTAAQLEARAAWLTALRSGDYARATGALRVGDGYCCLGVAEDVRGATWRASHVRDDLHVIDLEVDVENGPAESLQLTPAGADWLGLDERNPSVTVWRVHDTDDDGDDPVVGWTSATLAELNDEGWPFAEIAAVIADQPAAWRGAELESYVEATRRVDAGVPAPSYGAVIEP